MEASNLETRATTTTSAANCSGYENNVRFDAGPVWGCAGWEIRME